MIADITASLAAELRESQSRIDQLRLTSLWSFGQLMSRYGFELPDPMFQFCRYERTICLRYNQAVFEFSVESVVRRMPNLWLITPVGRRRYTTVPFPETMNTDEQYIAFAKRQIDEASKRLRTLLTKGADARWASINASYRTQGTSFQRPGHGL